MAEYTQSKFDSKSFNPVAFGAYVERIPATKRNELIKSRALRGNQQIKAAFSSQTGTAFATIPMTGRIGGTPLNYDGQTDITTQKTSTFERGVVVVGRAQSWTELDFSSDITGGTDFMGNVAQQVAEYWDGVDQDTLLSILKGIFSMTGTENLKFVNGHTYDITLTTGKDSDGHALNMAGSTTLNSAIQKACGDNKAKFTLAVMHSTVATNLENLNLLAYLKQIDKASMFVQTRLEASMRNQELLQMMKLEKSLVYFSTSLKGNEMVLEKMLRMDMLRKYPDDSDLLEDVIIENKQAMEMCAIYRDIMSGTMDAFASIISNNLNVVMKVLTSLTVVLSIPTLFASLWGMNVGVPFENAPFGFWMVLGISVVASVAAFVLLWRKKMF